jgi:hypothetical protein
MVSFLLPGNLGRYKRKHNPDPEDQTTSAAAIPTRNLSRHIVPHPILKNDLFLPTFVAQRLQNLAGLMELRILL